MNKKKGKLQINVPPERMEARYSDFAIISKNALGFNIDFGQRIPGGENIHLVSRIAMSPQHAKLLSKVLSENLENYEEKFGEIDLPDMPKREHKGGDMIHFMK